MELLISGKKIYFNSENGEPPSSKMKKWEFITSEERLDYGQSVMHQLLKKCKDTNVRILLNCFAPFLTEVNFNRVSVVSEILRSLDRPELNLILLCNFLDTRGVECPMPNKFPEQRTKMINMLVDMVLARLKNYMPNKCGTCRAWYTVPFGTIPDVICALCSRGRHDCTPVPLRHRSQKCFWFCVDCGIDIKDEFDGDRRKCFKDDELDNEPKEPKRHTGATESISSHVEVKSCSEDEDCDRDSNDSICSLLLDSDIDSVCDVTLSDYDTDNYEYFQEVEEEHQRPLKSMEVKYTLPVESRETKEVVSRETKEVSSRETKEVASWETQDNVIEEVSGKEKKRSQKKKFPVFNKFSDYVTKEHEFRVSKEEIMQAIAMVDCDVGLDVNAFEKSVPGISVIMGREALYAPLSAVTAMSLRDEVVPDNLKKAKVYYLVKNIKALLN